MASQNFHLYVASASGDRNVSHNGSTRVAIRAKAAGGGKGERKAAKALGTGDLRIGYGPDQFSLFPLAKTH